MKIYIDQSGKIEETAKDTILAMANDVEYSIRITGKTKRRIQDVFRLIGQPTTYVIATFTSCLYLLLEDHLKNCSEVVVDREYPGKEETIIKLLKQIYVSKHVINHPTTRFDLLGKTAPVHSVAWLTYRKKRKADRIITYYQLYHSLFDTKNRRPVLKHGITP